MVQTSAPQAMAEFTGTVLEQGQCRMRTLDHDGHVVPVLVVDIELESGLHNHLRVEQLFGHTTPEACKAAAHKFRKGMRITVQAPVVGLRVVAANTTHIHVHHPEKESTPA